MSPMRIDAHQHVWNLGVRDQPWTAGLPVLRRDFEFAELRPSLEKHGFDGSVVVQTVNDADETRELIALAASEPAVLGVVGWVDLLDPGLSATLELLRGLPGGDRLVGIRHQVQHEPAGWLARPEVRRGLGTLAELGIAYDLVVTVDQLDEAEAAIAAVPELDVVLDHGGKPRITAPDEFVEWSRRIRRIACHPLARAKLSGLITEAGDDGTVDGLRPYADELLDAFGPERVMFGSDWPVCLLAASYDATLSTAERLTSALGADERAAVFGGTAQSVYAIEPRGPSAAATR